MATSVPNTARYGAMVSAILAAMADKQLTATTLAKKLGPKVPVWKAKAHDYRLKDRR